MIGNIISCNNLSFCDDEFPDEGRNHNLYLHISMNCKNDSLSNVLIDNGSALNVIPRSMLINLKYQGAPMHKVVLLSTLSMDQGSHLLGKSI